MARRSEHTLEEIKTMVMNAAENIVIQEGYSGLKVRRIAMDIGYTVGSIYMVFNNMTDLVIRLKAKILDDLIAELDLIPEQQDSQLELLQLGKTYLQFATAHFNSWSMLFEHRLPDDKETPDWYQEKVNINIQRVEKLLSQLAEHVPPKQVNAAAKTLWFSLQGLCILSLEEDMNAADVTAAEANVVLLVRNFLCGWLQPPQLN